MFCSSRLQVYFSPTNGSPLIEEIQFVMFRKACKAVGPKVEWYRGLDSPTP